MKQIITGIDMGTHTTRVVVCEYSDTQAVPRVIGVGKSISSGIRNGYVVNKKEAVRSLKQALAQAEKSANVKIRKAFFSLGGIGLKSHVVSQSLVLTKSDGEVTAGDISRLTSKSEKTVNERFKNRRVIHAIPMSFKLDGESVLGQPVGLQGTKLEMRTLLITALEHHVIDMVDVAHAIGLDILDMIASPLALSKATLSPRQMTVGCALLDIGAETVTLAVFENSTPISLEVFSLGSTNITNDIALGFRIPLDEAEKIKTGDTENPSYSKQTIDDIVEARLSDIFELVQSHLKKINRDSMLPAGIVMTGGGSTLSTINDFAKATLKLPAHVVHVEHFTQARRKLADSSWLTAYGLCFFDHTSQGDTMGVGFGGNLKNLGGKIGSFVKQFLP